MVTDPRRILVVAGARALSRSPRAVAWAFREIASAMIAHDAGTVVHGRCESSPDEWADTIAKAQRITRVSFPLDSRPVVAMFRSGWALRYIEHAELYTYATPLDRNAAMARWAGHRLTIERDDVRALTLRCEWPLRDGERATQGTAYTRDRLIEALGAERVTDLMCPREYGPKETR